MTTETLHVGRFEARYHLPADAMRERVRLGNVLRRVLDRHLEDALARAGVPVDEEVCIRRLHHAVELRLDATDDALAERWCMGLATTIAGYIRDAGPGEVVRYRSRHHAVTDVVTSVLRGRRERAWAWRQLGLFDERAPVAALAVLLRDEPRAAVGVLSELARTGGLRDLVRRLEPEALASVALAALAERAPPSVVTRVSQHLRGGRVETAPRDAVLRARARLNGSTIGPALSSLAFDDARLAPVVALLVLLEVDPGGVLEPASILASLAAVEDALHDPGSGPPAATDAKRDGPDAHAPAGEAGPVDVSAHEHAAEVNAEADDALDTETLRRTGETDLGGLLFLLHPIQALELPVEAASDALRHRTLPWWLHGLALALTGAEPEDPAALALAGLPPGTVAPEGVPEEIEFEVIERWRQRIVDALRSLLDAPPEEPDAALLSRVCRRPARIVADPGWIEVHLSLDDVSVELRRTGLDLDPGFLPWLGVVVRFVYG